MFTCKVVPVFAGAVPEDGDVGGAVIAAGAKGCAGGAIAGRLGGGAGGADSAATWFVDGTEGGWDSVVAGLAGSTITGGCGSTEAASGWGSGVACFIGPIGC